MVARELTQGLGEIQVVGRLGRRRGGGGVEGLCQVPTSAAAPKNALFQEAGGKEKLLTVSEKGEAGEGEGVCLWVERVEIENESGRTTGQRRGS